MVDRSAGRVYAYGTDGVRDHAAEFALDDDNDVPKGIAHVADGFYVVDGQDNMIYAYSLDGVPDPRGPFPIDGPRFDPTGIGHAAGGFYVVHNGFYGRQGWSPGVYANDGIERTLRKLDWDAVGFDFHNPEPSGITYADGMLFVVDAVDDMVYAYRIDGL